MTLAASITLGNRTTVISYQYICIKIFAINSQKPCFQTTPVIHHIHFNLSYLP